MEIVTILISVPLVMYLIVMPMAVFDTILTSFVKYDEEQNVKLFEEIR